MSDYDDASDRLDFEADRSRSRSRTPYTDDSDSGSGNSQSGTSRGSRSRSRSYRRSWSRSRRSPSRGSSRRSVSPAVPRRSPAGAERRMPIQKLQDTATRCIKLQLEDIISKIDQKRVRAAARSEYGAKGLADAYIPNSRVTDPTREHVRGCPCDICVSLHHTLEDSDRDDVVLIRGLRNWVVKGGRRPLTLLIPALPSAETELKFFAFCGPLEVLLQMEKTHNNGISLHHLLANGRAPDTPPTRWTGGSPSDPPIKRQNLSASATGDTGHTASVLDKDIQYVKDGPVSYARYEIKEVAEKPAKYTASREAMGKARDLFALSKSSLEKAVRDFTHDQLEMSKAQFRTLKTPPIPPRFDRAVNMDAPAKVRESALSAVGASLNYAVVGAVKMSEQIATLDEIIPLTELHMSAVNKILASPPVYIPPSERKNAEAIVASLKPGQKCFMDPATIEENKDHYLRSKGEKLCIASSVLKDIYFSGDRS